MTAAAQQDRQATVVRIEPRAVSAETAAAMLEYSTETFDRWRRRWGLEYLPHSQRFAVADLDAAIDKWRANGSPVHHEEIDAFDEGTAAHG